MIRFLTVLVWAAGVMAQTHARPAVTLAVYILLPCPPGAAGSLRVQTAEGFFCRERQPFLTQADVEAAEIQPGSGGRTLVFLTFQHDAAMRELQVTRKNIGNHVGIVLNGRVVGTPLISAASRLLYIDDHFTRQQAEEIVGAF